VKTYLRTLNFYLKQIFGAESFGVSN